MHPNNTDIYNGEQTAGKCRETTPKIKKELFRTPTLFIRVIVVEVVFYFVPVGVVEVVLLFERGTKSLA